MLVRRTCCSVYHICSFTDVSGVPDNLRLVDVSYDTVTVEWSAPKNDGGSKIMGYIIEKKEIGRRTFHHVVQVNSSVVRKWKQSNFSCEHFCYSFSP